MRILIAEDETIIRLDLRGILEHAGLEVCGEAKNGEEAVELARELAPDLAILDVKMPRLDGLEAARRIYAERPLPIVILTAFSARSLVAEAVDAGVFAYLVKPFRPQEILCAIETAAARHDDLLHARRALGRKLPERSEADLRHGHGRRRQRLAAADRNDVRGRPRRVGRPRRTPVSRTSSPDREWWRLAMLLDR